MKLLTRQDIANLTGVSVSTIRKKEKRWGLDKLRSKIVIRPACYLPIETTELLKSLKLIE